MRELEFLPHWYPAVRRQRKRLLLQSAITAVVGAGLLLWMQLAMQNTAAARESLSLLDQQVTQVKSELQLLDEQTVLLAKLRKHQDIESQLKLGIEMTRLLSSVEQCLPAEMAILEINIDTETTKQTLAQLAAGARRGKTPEPQTRTLRVRVSAVAPTDAEITQFFSRLTELGVFQNVRMNYARDRNASGRQMREVEVVFGLPLEVQVEQ
ncbi:MAG TPA: hypothetical protein PKB10_02355 [Tepidisphaeraceae bacterium]|nr:hypothetical protein [Tepidisphaeraceae bacterium]